MSLPKQDVPLFVPIRFQDCTAHQGQLQRLRQYAPVRIVPPSPGQVPDLFRCLVKGMPLYMGVWNV